MTACNYETPKPPAILGSKQLPADRFRYVNFIEVGLPLFRTDKLENFLKNHYRENSTASWGVDFWYMNSMGFTKNYLNKHTVGKAAIFDSVGCYNPPPGAKNKSATSNWHRIGNDGKGNFEKIVKPKYKIISYHAKSWNINDDYVERLFRIKNAASI
uniref:Uncharacterized protein n=1 Tax=Aplanochytrium stocchinoi TaxID=215587 RepID=A0A7S3V0X9_9STRA